jgi:hypothetical protein
VDCTHSWRTCPVHNPDGGVPPPRVAMTCIYGGAPTVDGDPWDEHDTDEVLVEMAFGITAEDMFPINQRLQRRLGDSTMTEGDD